MALLFLILFNPSFAFSPISNGCGQGTMAAMEFSKFMMWLADTGEHPYASSCDPAVSSNSEPRRLQTIYDLALPNKTSGGKPLATFFELIRDRVKIRIQEEKEKANWIKSCLKNQEVDACLSVNPLVAVQMGGDETYKFSQLVVEARFHLLLSKPNGFFSYVKQSLNYQMDTFDFYKEKPWKRTDLKSEEFRFAKETYQEYLDSAEKNAAGMPNATGNQIKKRQEAIAAEIGGKLEDHFESYKLAMSAHPVLQHIQSENPDIKEVRGAVDAVLASLEKEEQFLADIGSSLDTENSLDTDLLKLLNYQTEVFSVLEENNEYCGISRDLRLLFDSKDLGKSIGLALPIMAASVFMPPAYIVAGGLLTAGTLAGREQSLANEQKLAVVGRIEGEEKGLEAQSLSGRILSRDIELALAPLALVGVGKVTATKMTQASRAKRLATWVREKNQKPKSQIIKRRSKK